MLEQRPLALEFTSAVAKEHSIVPPWIRAGLLEIGLVRRHENMKLHQHRKVAPKCCAPHRDGEAYCEARQHEPEPEPAESSATDDVRHGDSARVPSATTRTDPASEQSDALLAQLALKDEAIAQAQVVVAKKDVALAAAVAEKDAALGAGEAEKAQKEAALAEVTELRAQLSKLEGVPPPVQAGR
eukprot:COSAG06_NODE_2226_length_7302_cov_6.886853_6_plen_185_part_00